MNNKVLHAVTFILVIIGALNWGLSALNFNLVHMVLGGFPSVERLVYLLVGLSAVVQIVTHTTSCIYCGAKKK